MKNLTYLLFFFTTLVIGQNKVLSKSGAVSFEASVPSFEEVKAKLENAGCALNTGTGDIAVIVYIKNFQFKNALMQEHFNENYMESDQFPKATFIGKILDFNVSNLNTQKQDCQLKGNFQIHGKTKEMTVPAKISKTDKGIQIWADFVLNTDDFNISLPFLIRSKVSKQVHVTTTFTLL